MLISATGCLQRLVTQTFLTLSPRSLTVTRSMPGKKRKSDETEAKETKKAKPEKKNKSDTKWEEVEWERRDDGFCERAGIGFSRSWMVVGCNFSVS